MKSSLISLFLLVLISLPNLHELWQQALLFAQSHRLFWELSNQQNDQSCLLWSIGLFLSSYIAGRRFANPKAMIGALSAVAICGWVIPHVILNDGFAGVTSILRSLLVIPVIALGVILAKELSERCNKIKPNNGSFQETYGWVLYKLKEYKGAKEWIGKSLKNGGDKFPDTLEHYGDVLYQLGDRDEALLYWQSAQEKGSTSETLEKKISEKKLIEQ